jgi:pimeloyl-ACP methyl ester carboxylesterase
VTQTISPSPAQAVIKTPVVFFPGTLCDERVFMPCWQALNLAERAYSPLQWADSLEQMMALSLDRLAYYDQPMHLLGFSMGGYIASLVALKQPEKVASLTLVGFNSDSLSARESEQKQQTLQAISSSRYQGMSQARLAHLLHSGNADNQSVIATKQQMDADLGSPVLASQIKATADRENLTAQLAQSDFPIHLVTGEQDNIASPQALRLMQQQMPNSEHLIIADAGHMLPLEQPKALAQYLQRVLS